MIYIIYFQIYDNKNGSQLEEVQCFRIFKSKDNLEEFRNKLKHKWTRSTNLDIVIYFGYSNALSFCIEDFVKIKNVKLTNNIQKIHIGVNGNQ